jgi:hypothetical protein
MEYSSRKMYLTYNKRKIANWNDVEACATFARWRQMSLSLWFDRLRLLQWEVYKCEACGNAYRKKIELNLHKSWSHRRLQAQMAHFDICK